MKPGISLASPMRLFTLIIGVTVVYFLTARLGLMLAFEQTSSSPVWPPAGIGLAAVLLLGYRVFPGILMGVFIANVTVFINSQTGTIPITSVLTSLSIAIGSTLEPLAGAYLFRRLIGQKNSLNRGQDVFTFVIAGAISCLISSIIGPTSICLAELAPWDIFGMMSFTWWMGDLSGVLIVTPIFLGWSRLKLDDFSIPKVIEAVILWFLLSLIGLFVFGGWANADLVHLLAYLVIPVLLWIAFRFNQQISAIAIAFISGMIIWATTHGVGPFMAESLNTSLILVQGFVSVIAIVMLVLAASITEKREAMKTVQEREEKYRSLFDDALDMIHIVDVNGKIIDANKIEIEALGYTREEYLGKPVIEIIHPDFRTRTKKSIEKVFKGVEVRGHETVFLTKHGDKIEVEINAVPQLMDRKIIAGRAFIRDVTERKQAEEQIKASLKEKETLLHEVHHRVKNNMQVINSLLKLQSNSIEDDRIKEILKECQSRVYAMSAVHETLHGSEKLSKIDLKTYLSKITISIFQTYSTDHRNVKLISNVDDAPISINQAYPLGLIITELISNSLKYAFPDDQSGEITVKMKKYEHELELIAMDDGIGMSKNLDWKSSKTLGLKLVRTLVENQLDGTIDLESKNGTKFTIKFNIET